MTDNRMFQERNRETGDFEWFLESREGIMGPYESKDLVKLALVRHKERCHRDRLDGGRHFAESRQLSPDYTMKSGSSTTGHTT